MIKQNISSLLQLGIKHLQNNQIAFAEDIFNKIIKLDPRHPDALHMLGVVQYRNGNSKDAIRLIKKSIKIKPNVSVYHRNYGIALISAEKYKEAINELRKAVKLDGNDFQAYNELGTIYSRIGRINDATKMYKKSIYINPNNIMALYNIGNNCLVASRFTDAEKYFKKYISSSSNNKDAYRGLGDALMYQKKYEQAIDAYNESLNINQNQEYVINSIGTIKRKQQHIKESIEYFNKAIAINPKYSNAYSNLGNSYRDLSEFNRAIEQYIIAIKYDQGNKYAYDGLGVAYNEMLRIDEAISSYKKAISIDGEYANAHFNLSLALLLCGQFKNGWREYEYRWKSENFQSPKRNFSQPQWGGQMLDGKTIFIHAEQGIGDTIQFIRYIEKVAKYNGEIIVECQKPLIKLLSNFSQISKLIYSGDDVPNFDFHSPLLSLPYILGTEVSSIPSNIPYISVDRKFNIDNKQEHQISIGIVWAGSPAHKNDKNRSTTLDNFLKLLSIDNVKLFSLQVGDRKKDLDITAINDSIVDLTDNIQDYSDTASIIKQLDLVISVDTSVAHLSGAMGKPTWTLIPYSPDFRWMLNRKDSPWYPSMKLFRQSEYGNWDDVFDNVLESLKQFNNIH